MVRGGLTDIRRGYPHVLYVCPLAGIKTRAVAGGRSANAIKISGWAGVGQQRLRGLAAIHMVVQPMPYKSISRKDSAETELPSVPLALQ